MTKTNKKNVWDNSLAAKYMQMTRVKNALSLRINTYRVLLTRGRDGVVIFIPPMDIMRETYAYLKKCGFNPLIKRTRGRRLKPYVLVICQKLRVKLGNVGHYRWTLLVNFS